MKRQNEHFGVDHLESTNRSILWKRAILGGIVLFFAATPILTAVGYYSSIDWTIGSGCGDFVDISPQCGTPPERAARFITSLIIFCAALALLFWLIGSIMYAILRAVTPEAGRTALVGMAIGSGAAAITLLVASIASYFFIDWERHYWERQLFASRTLSAQSVGQAIDAGVDINLKNNRGETRLHTATWMGNLAVTQALLVNGADVHAKDDDGRTPLHRAASSGTSAVIQALLDAGADIEAKSNEIDDPPVFSSHMRGETPLHKAARNPNDDLAVFEALLHAGADINAKNDLGETPLHTAAEWGTWAMIQALLDAGADINAKTVDGKTPLDLAKDEGNSAAVTLLRKASGF